MRVYVEVGLEEVGSLKDAVREVGGGQVTVAKVGTLKVDIAQVEVGQVESFKIQSLHR